VPNPRLAAIVIFVLVYAFIVAGEHTPRKLDRPSSALVGAVLMVLAGVLTRLQAMAAIDFSTIALLLGMMIVIHYATDSGLVEWIAASAMNRARSPRLLLIAVGLAAGFLSALFINDTICLLLTPIVLSMARRMSARAEPYLIALATSSNVGSLATLTGNPQNMLIGQSSGWAWGAFAARMAPVGIVCLAVNIAIVLFVYRRDLSAETWSVTVPESSGVRLDRKLATKTCVVMIGLLAAFVAGANTSLAALTAAVAILVLADRPAARTFVAVDWSLLLFFAGLFVVVAGMTRTEGAMLFHWLPIANVGGAGRLAGLSAVSVVGSNLFSNVPFVMLVRGWIASHGSPRIEWLMLAASCTLAGNLTLVGSVANLIVAQRSKDEAPLSFVAFLRVGVPSTLATVAISVLLIWIMGRLEYV
jgi:Na+/H+ antiporter NhaD/arsenite permease-like protein